MTDDDESIAEKKERMRRYMEADRKLEAERDKRHRRRNRGCLMGTVVSLFKLAVVAAVVGGIGYAIWLWHPWDTEIVTTDASDHPGVCSPGVEGTHTEEYLRIFGVRVMKSGESTICAE